MLISPAEERPERRRFNEAVLDTGRPVHRFGDAMAATVREELAPLLERRTLTWDDFAAVFWRIVRRVVLGDGARDDDEVTDALRKLRGDANWSYVTPPRTWLRDGFLRQLSQHLDRAEDGSLAARIRGLAAGPDVVPYEQVPQWLFAFDAAGMAAFRAVALVGAHDVDATADDTLRATVLESIRLWPTTPAILRDTTTETEWQNGTLASGTGIVVFAPLFHRTGDHAHRFAPELWIPRTGEGPGPSTDLGRALVPFSAGPGICPGRDLVLFLTVTILRTLLAGRRVAKGPLDPGAPMPASLSPFRLRFEFG